MLLDSSAQSFLLPSPKGQTHNHILLPHDSERSIILQFERGHVHLSENISHLRYKDKSADEWARYLFPASTEQNAKQRGQNVS